MTRWYRWWYAALALGFFLLGLNVWLAGRSPVVRWLVAGGFAMLAWMEWKKPVR